MNLITAQNLWKDYDPRLLPLGETELFTEYTDDYSVKHVYFNGIATSDGCTRIYARLYSPATIPSGAGIVLMNGADNDFDMTFVLPLIECGHTVLVIDYTGKKESGICTIYPKSLSYANYHTIDSDYNSYVTDAKKNSHYVYACVMMRGFVYLESISSLDKNRLTLFGVNEGGFNVYKTAYLMHDAACAVTVFNSSIIPGIDIESEAALPYNTGLSSSVYMPLIKVPLFIVDSSNNSDCSLADSNALYESSTDVCRLMVADHADNTLSEKQMASIMSYINTMCFSHLGVPATPTLEPVSSGRALYYNVKISDPENVESVNLYYSYDGIDGAFKYWSALKLEHVTGAEYIAKADVYKGKSTVTAFAVVTYRDGLILSSEIVTKNALLMGVNHREIVKSRRVYGSDMGVNDWVITGKTNLGGKLSVEQDASGIEGVTSSVNSLTNLKIGDVIFSGEEDNLLQLLIYTEKNQTLTLTVTANDEENPEQVKKYYCSVTPSSFGSWSKITLSPDNFRSPSGPLDSWTDLKCLTVDSEKKLLINSILWI